MIFDYDKVKDNIQRVKPIVESGGFEKLKYIGRGAEGCVRAFENVAVKEWCGRYFERMRLSRCQVMEREKTAYEHGVILAPEMEIVDKNGLYTFMPLLEGNVVNDEDLPLQTRVDDLARLGAEGFRKFFTDTMELEDLGLTTIDTLENIMVVGNNIARIDLLPKSPFVTSDKITAVRNAFNFTVKRLCVAVMYDKDVSSETRAEYDNIERNAMKALKAIDISYEMC